ncbi:MAG: T9SS type A sorting domain-containing protein [Bacteroidota bacterium]|jgi:hypothetical protein
MKIKILYLLLTTFIIQCIDAQIFDWAKAEGLWAYDYGYGITTDAGGNVYVTGKYEQQANFSNTILNTRGNHDVFIAKYDANGNVVWIKTAGGAMGDYGTSISCDGNKYLYVAGEVEGYGIPVTFDNSNVTFNSVGDNDIFFAKYDLSGNLIWAKHAGAYKNDKALGITHDKSGNVVICGLFEDSTVFEGNHILLGKGNKDILVAKFDSLGNYLWARTAGSPFRDEAKSVICDSMGNVYVTGMFSDTVDFGGITLISPNGYFDMFLAKYDTNGNIVWVKQGSSDYDEVGWGVTKTVDEKIIVTGEYNAYALFDNLALVTSGMSDIFIAAYDSNGNIIWTKSAGGSLIERARGIGTDGFNIFITGQFGGQCNFGTEQLNATDSSDVFISAIDNNGNFIWTVSAGGTPDSLEQLGYESGIAVCGDPIDGSVYATGSILDGGTFGVNTIGGYKRTDIFVCKISTEISAGINFNNAQNEISVINPCTEQLIINCQSSLEPIKISIYTTDGKLIEAKKLSEGEKQIEIEFINYQEGVYIMKLETNNKMIERKFIHIK